jgi:hypothetical protein
MRESLEEKGLENGCDDCKVVQERCGGDWTLRAFVEKGITAERSVGDSTPAKKRERENEERGMEIES